MYYNLNPTCVAFAHSLLVQPNTNRTSNTHWQQQHLFHPTWYSLQLLYCGSYPVVNHTDIYFVIEINDRKNTDHLKLVHMDNTNKVNKQTILFVRGKIKCCVSPVAVSGDSEKNNIVVFGPFLGNALCSALCLHLCNIILRSASQNWKINVCCCDGSSCSCGGRGCISCETKSMGMSLSPM